MRRLIFSLLLLLPLPGWAATTNSSDLEKCLQYTDPAVRGQCVQFYKRTSTRAAVAECRQDLECWSKRHRELAEKYCSRAFDMRAARSAFWDRHWDGQDFDKVRWQDQGRGILVYYEEEPSVSLQCVFFPNAPARVRVSIGSRG